jgi:SAM-dependent methyltransferase
MNALRNIKSYVDGVSGKAEKVALKDGGTGERSWPKKLDEVPPDAKSRYCMVIEFCQGFQKPMRILDAGCGVGFGSWMLGQKGNMVTGVDFSRQALEHAREHFSVNDQYLLYQVADLMEMNPNFYTQDVIVAFEVLEHLAFPEKFLQWVRDHTKYFFVSVPNQAENPYNPVDYPFHFRHYTPSELYEILDRNGFEVQKYLCQRDKWKFDMHNGTNGRTLIAICKVKS